MSDDPKRLAHARRNIDYYETVVVVCLTCKREWSTGWNQLEETQDEAARHWLAEHDI